MQGVETTVKQLRCRECGRTRPLQPAFVCEHCFGPLEVTYDFAALRGGLTPALSLIHI